MSIFSKIAHGFEHLGHDIAHVAKDVGKGFETVGKDIGKVGKGVVEGVEHVGKELAQDASHVAGDVLQSAEAMMQGHLREALNKALQAGQDLTKTAVDVGTSGQRAVIDSLSNMHLSKGMDRAMSRAAHGYDAVKDMVVKTVNQVEAGVVNDAEGAVNGTVEAARDAVHGHFGDAAKALGGAAMDAVSVAGEITPEGAAAAIGTQLLQNAHIGNERLDSAIFGALRGNVAQMAKAAAKNVAKAEIGGAVEDKLAGVASKVLPGTGGGGDNAVGMAAFGSIAGTGAGSLSFGSKRSRALTHAGTGDRGMAHRSGESERTAAEHGERKTKRDDDKAQQGLSAGGGDSAPGLEQAVEQLLMLQMMKLQGGAQKISSAAKKRRAELRADS